MKLVINLSMLGSRPTGLGVYSENCARGITERFHCELISGANLALSGTHILKSPESLAIGSGRFAAIKRQSWLRSIKLDNNRLVYSPTHHGLPNHDVQVITIHDLICLRFPMQHKSQYLFFKIGLPRILKKCRAIITVSETTKQDVAHAYGYPLDRIFVVPNGVDTSVFFPDFSVRPDEPFLLMVGARYSHKNVDEVLNVSKLWAKNFRLVITSCNGEYKKHLLNKIKKMKLQERVIFNEYLSLKELVHLYQGCSALIYPSKWEGFGIPPLEALACGAPVIASDIPAHREVLGDAAIFVQLGNFSSWEAAFSDITNVAKVKLRANAAIGRLEKFSLDGAVNALECSLLKIESRLEESRKTLNFHI